MRLIRASITVAAIVLTIFSVPTTSHVALTYPPARKYDLDFLDNSRTKAPCGMPKGNIKTSVLAGSKFNVTWHLGYPHRGGFKIQLLDHLERPVLDLTPTIKGSEFVANDATAQSYQVQLPNEYTCNDCTLRLIRQALEWSNNYKFWSCADVDIKSKKEYRETCSNHGRYILGRCKCDRLYYGDRCQYRDECWENSDCGEHGKCIDIKATTAPRQQCYCELGWFGPGCNKRSAVKTTDIDFGLYTEKKLSDTFRLYWRILKEHKELEVVMVINGTGYAGIGWRPSSLTSSCKNFPLIEPLGNESPSGKPEPSSEPEPKSKPEPSAEPEPTQENKSKREPSTEPTPGPKSQPEPSSEPEPTTAEPEPTTTTKTKYRKSLYSRRSASPSPRVITTHDNEDVVETSVSYQVSARQGRRKRSEEGQPQESLHAYTPRHDFNPMDCTDMIIGSARHTASRIADYYTRDRSTPKMDNFWGGKNDLTAAMGFEKDGVTTILFRKKLVSQEQSDHSIENELMHVIWAQGQEKGKYVHVPKSGIESDNATVKDFYKEDELKYHGHGAQRGVTTINFFDEKKITIFGGDSSDSVDDLSHCGGEWRLPRSCNPENYTCEYSAKWEYLPRGDNIQFTITSKYTDRWTGIAFSNDEKMSQTDAILGWVDKTGRPFLMDTWINGYTQPFLDPSQGIFNTSGRIVDGITILSFIRKRISNDVKDLSFTDDTCLFMMYPVRGGDFNSVNKKIRKHEIPPIISTERICIKSCGNDFLDELDKTTPEPPYFGYNMEVKIVNLGENFQAPQPGTAEYEVLSNTVSDNIKSIFTKLPNYQKIKLDVLQEKNNDLIAMLSLHLNKPISDKGRSLDEDGEQENAVRLLLEDSVKTGRIGALKVDPQYLVFKPEITTDLNVDASEEPNSFFSLSGTKLYIVLGCLAALVLLALIQASCTIYKTTKKSSSSHKDHLLQNSAWKDYSTANTNYAFDTFEHQEKQINGNNRSETLPSKNHSRGQRPQGRPPSVPLYNSSQIGDTRSLQRPRGAYPPGHLERNTLSLPRTTYDRHRGPQDMQQPDFYFMPSQRKYSGEVVRVYVDYNNKPK